ncbi:MAG: DUF4097 family beta strand repeat-containing protein [Terriglobales bacterium]
MATAPTPGPCRCPACSFRRLTAPLVLIAIGVLLLLHMLPAGFTTAALIGAFLVFVGALGLVARLLPRPVGHHLAASIFFPLLLLIIGILILARHSLPYLPVGAWIANYWPLLLILWGLTRLLEHLARPARTRAGLSGGEIFLVIIIVIFGLSFSGAYHFRQSRWATYWGVNLDRWNPFLESYQFTASTRAAVSGAAPLEVVVRGFRGDVTVTAGPPGAIAAAVSDTIHSGSRQEAQTVFAAAQPQVRQEGGQWLVMPSGADTAASLRADLQLTLPASAPLTVQIASGDITVPAWQAPLDLHSTHGAITASGAAGNVQITAGHGPIQLSHVRGNVSITGGGSDISVSDVSGVTLLQGEYVGSLQFSNLAQGLQFHSSRTDLELAALPGTLNYDLGEIAITNASGIKLRTRDVEVNIQDFGGALTVSNRNDSIHVSSATAPAAPVTLSNHDADISLRLPAASQFHLDAIAHNGDVDNRFGAASQAAAPEIRLTTSSGTISVRPGGGH